MTESLDSLLSDEDLRQIIHHFYLLVWDDPLLAPLFANVNRSVQEQRLQRFIRMTASPGSECFDGAFLRDAHASLNLTEAHFERRRELLARAMRDCGHGEEIVIAWQAYDARWRKWVLGL